jgi:hypothetical protein
VGGGGWGYLSESSFAISLVVLRFFTGVSLVSHCASTVLDIISCLRWPVYMIYTTFRELNMFLFQVTPWDFTDRFIISAVKIELGTL